MLKQQGIHCRLGLIFAAFACAAVTSVPALAAQPPSVSFVNDVMPMLTRHGCNAGVCHAKAGNGQNGFQLSLLGFEPAEDYEHVVKEARGRRLFPAVPENSLLLLKATGPCRTAVVGESQQIPKLHRFLSNGFGREPCGTAIPHPP